MPVKVGKGRSGVTITGPIADDLEAELRALLGPVIDELEFEAEEILYNEIGPNWPVKSGKSKDGWQTRLKVNEGSLFVEIDLYNPIDYTFKIRGSTRLGRMKDATRSRTPWIAHAKKPGAKAVKVLRKRLPAVVAQALSDKVFE
jgi:hypothetical protein